MEDFLNSLPVKENNYKQSLERLWNGVAETNKLIGLDPANMTDEQRVDTLKQYASLCYEEGYVEGEEAIEKKDRVLLLDSLIDLFVVGFFHMQSSYYTFEEAWDYYLVPDQIGDSELHSLMESRQSSSEIAGIKSSLYFNSNILNYLSVDVNRAVTEVLKSNLSKFCTVSELQESMFSLGIVGGKEFLISNQISLIEEQGRYSGVYCEEVVDNKGETRLVFWCTHEYGKPKSKYVKPCTFVDADFASCWVD